MRTLLFICGLALVAAGSPSWENFKLTHGKSYSNTEEDLYRKSIFEENLKYVEEHNKRFSQGLVSFDLKMNRFGDMKNDEFVAQMTGLKKVERKAGKVFAQFPDIKRADSIDWREKGGVTPVKDQGQCGSCWAFSTAGTLEGVHFAKYGELISMSEQNLVDCCDDNEGCDGGNSQSAFECIRDDGGIDTEESYPYEAVQKTCRFDPSQVAATDTGFIEIPPGDEKVQAQAVHDVGPVSVAVDARNLSFQLYSSGIYFEPNCELHCFINHAVVAVGYGTEEGEDYWLLKNSWGTEWGDAGFMKLARNRDNHCGIATQSCYPTV